MYGVLIGLINEMSVKLIIRDMIAFLPFLVVPYYKNFKYNLLLKYLFLFAIIAVLYGVIATFLFGYRAHYHFENLLIPYANFILVIGFYLYTINKVSFLKLLFIVLISLLGILTIASKTNVIILFLTMFIFLFFKKTMSLSIVFFIIFFAVLYFITTILDIDIQLLARIIEFLSSSSDSSTNSRLNELHQGVNHFLNHYILGTGFGSTINAYGRDILFYHLSLIYLFVKFGLFVGSFIILLLMFFLIKILAIKETNMKMLLLQLYTIFVGYLMFFPAYKYITFNIYFSIFLCFLIFYKGKNNAVSDNINL
jgi:hypothetical protein